MTFNVASDCTSITITSAEFASLGLPGAYATGILTVTGQVFDSEGITIDTKTYVLKETLSNIDGYVFIEGDASGFQVLQSVGQPGDSETIVVDGKTYTFQTVLTNVDGNIQIDVTASKTLENLVAAVNLAAGAGTKYATATTAGNFTAINNDPNVTFTYYLPGTVGNGLSMTDTVTGWTWVAPTTNGGTNDTSGTLGNLAAAILLGAGAGTKYAVATTAHTTVTVDSVGPTTLNVRSILIGIIGNTYATTEGMGNGMWGDTTLTGGIDIPVYSNIDIVATDPDDTEITVNIGVGDLTGSDYVVDDAYFGTSTWAPNMYKFTLNKTLPLPTAATIDEGCVLVDCELQCEVWDKVKDNITSNDCKRTEFHLVYESLLNTNGCSTCSCDTALALYKQLKDDVTNITYNSDCGC